MYIGIIKWFNSEKGYGVIERIQTRTDVSRPLGRINLAEESRKNDEIFLHISNWKDKVPIDLSRIIPVAFETAFERNKLAAKNCTFIQNSYEEWSLIFSLLGRNEFVHVKERYSFHSINVVNSALESISQDSELQPFSDGLQKGLTLIEDSVFVQSCSTLFAFIKTTTHKNLQQLIREQITIRLKESAVDIRFSLWEKNILRAEAFKKEELINCFNQIKSSDYRKVWEHPEADEITRMVLSKGLSLLKEKFSVQEFSNFGKLIDVLAKEDVRIEFTIELNELANERLLYYFKEELSSAGRIYTQSDLDILTHKFGNLESYLEEDLKSKLNQEIETHILQNSSGTGLINACLSGFFSDPFQKIKSQIQNFNSYELRRLFVHSDNFSLEEKHELLKILTSDPTKHELILTIADEIYFDGFLSEKEAYYSTLQTEIETLIYENAEASIYIDLWQKKLVQIFPDKFLRKHFDEKIIAYDQIVGWIKGALISREYVDQLLFEKLNRTKKVEGRESFHQMFNIIELLVKINSQNIEKVIGYKNELFGLYLWFLDLTESFNFDFLKGKFIYFHPNQQVHIIKKLFGLKQQGKFELTISRLDELVRADVDLFRLNEKFNQDFALDLSTSIVIEALKQYSKASKFLVESEMLKIVLNDIRDDKSKRFQIADYFEICPGRMSSFYNWKGKGEIRKEYFGNKQFYYAIIFEFNEDLVERVQKLPKRRFNKETKHWGVPYRYEADVIEFARNNKFVLNLGENKYADNIHLVEYKRTERPNGVKFCEGRLANKPHGQFNQKFWWCNGQACLQNQEITHESEDWKNFTLLDFCKILGLNIDEEGRPGDLIPNGKYYQFVSLINRFNKLLDKLYCQDCNEILYPVENAFFAAHNVVKFQCANKNCKNRDLIYLNHCLNGKCNAIIDSRVSKTCPNGLYICELCGSCCSHSFFERRLKVLEMAASIDNSKKAWIYNDTRNKFFAKLGHLDRGQYFCHKCGKEMKETKAECFECYECNIVYDTASYRFERPFRYLRNQGLSQ